MLVSHLKFLYNGGLDPEIADPGDLKQRRTLSLCIFTLAPLGFLIVLSNLLYSAKSDNPTILFGLFLVLSTLYIQAYGNKPTLAGNICIFAYWIIPAWLILRHGLLSTPVLWLLPIPSLSLLIASRNSGLLWLGVCITTVWVGSILESFGVLTPVGAVEQHMLDLLGENAYLIYAFEMSLVLIILTGSTFVFRALQMSAEEKLRANLKSLRSEVHTRTLAEESARVSEQSKTNFLAVMSHELRTPLNGIVGAANLLRRSNSEQERSEFTDVIQQSSNNLIELINNVMDLSSLESGKLLLDKKPIRLDEFLSATARPFSYQAEKKSIQLELQVTDDVPEFIIGDPIRLRQILINLLGNALKFTDSGSIKLIADIDYGKLRIQVEDSGTGIAETNLKNLFDPYVQAGDDSSKRTAGSGLGLAIVKRLVLAMEGNITVKSELGSGTLFTIHLPVQAARVEEALDEIDLSNAPAQLNALIADDNAVNCMVLSRILEKDNHKVVVVNTGLEALEYVRNNSVDVILMDIQMPEMDGVTAAREIRGLNSEKSQIPIIAITANINKEEEERALSAGMNGFVGKPFRYEDLMSKLGSVIRTH